MTEDIKLKPMPDVLLDKLSGEQILSAEVWARECVRAHRQGRQQTRQVAGAVREPVNGDGWTVHWWNESMRLMLPDGMRVDSFQSYRTGTMQLTIKADAQRAKGDGK